MASITIKSVAAYALFYWAGSAFAHVSLEQGSAPAGGAYKAVLRVGHGCEGAPTTGMKVLLPAGFQGAKPMPKAGWTLATKTETLATPYTSHGKQITQDVSEISWTASTPASYLPDAHYDEFVLRGQLPDQVGPLWFKVVQTCVKGSNDWIDVPAAGTSTKGLKAPAALLQVKPADPHANHH